MAAPIALVLGAIAVNVLLYWPMPLYLRSDHALTAFGDSHAALFHLLYRWFSGEGDPATFLGFPYPLEARIIGWAPALASLPLQPLLGALGAYNVVMLATPALTALAAYGFLRGLSRADPWVTALLSLVYAFSPYAMTSLANGQIEKAQLWIYPLYLLFLLRFVRGQGRAALLGIVAVVIAASFTCPYFALILPLGAVPMAAVFAWGVGDAGEPSSSRSRSRWGATLRAILALACTAGALLPAYEHYNVHGSSSVFRFAEQAAQPGEEGILYARALASPVAQPEEFFFGTAPFLSSPLRCRHTTYIMLPTLIVALVLSRRAFPGRAAGWLLVGVGGSLAFGPRLVQDNVYMNLGSVPYWLPAKLLELLGYPLSAGGQYYRVSALATLGLPILVCGGVATRGAAARLGVLALVLLQLADNARVLGRVPWPSERFPGIESLEALSEGEPGPVLALPLLANETLGGLQMLGGSFHRQRTSAVARGVRGPDVDRAAPWVLRWARIVDSGDDEAARAFLRELGFRSVVLYSFPERELQEEPLVSTERARRRLAELSLRAPTPPAPMAASSFRLDRSTLQRVLGRPTEGDRVLIWTLVAGPE